MITKRCILGLLCVALLMAVCIPWGVAYAKDTAVSDVTTTTVKTTVTTIIPTTTTTEASTTSKTTVTAIMPTTTTTMTTTTTVAPTTAVSCVQRNEDAKWCWPLLQTNGAVSAGYGYRWGNLHRGIDIAAAVGDPVVAAADGKVIACELDNYNGGYGTTVLVDHGNGVQTLYAHLESIAVAVGEHVAAGQTIAAVGMTGVTTGACLHFEVRVNDVAVDPLEYIGNADR